jgi:LysM domain
MTNDAGRDRMGFVTDPFFRFISARRCISALKIFFQEAGMTTKTNVLIQAACVSLLLALLPGTAAPQEPKETAAEQQPAKASGGPEQLKSEAVTTPSTGAAEPRATQPAQEAAPAIAAEAAAPAAEKESLYTIKRGDTLWDIANAFFKDPFLWPFIWKANPPITNPDLIYAGNKLVIPSLAPIERAIQAPSAPAPTEERGEEIAAAPPARPKPPVSVAEEAPAGGGKIILPEEEAQPVIDKYSFLSAGFVDDMDSVGAIVGPVVQAKTIMGYDDVVYVRFSSENVNVGDKFLIYAPLGVVKHPRTREPYGRLIRGLGILQITAKDPSADVLTARITLSFDSIEGGSLLAPYQEPSLVFESGEKKAKDISGYILEVTDHRTINGQTDVVYLDKGHGDGVDPGDKFIVYADPAKRGYPREIVGEVQVFLVKERTSTAMVRKSIDPLQKGQAVDFKK